MTVEMLRPVFARAFKYWNEDQAPRYAAAITFYLMLAMSPLLLFFVGASSLILQSGNGQNPLKTELLDTVSHSLGSAQGAFLQGIIDSNHSRGSGYFATIFGLVVALFAASGLFQQLRLSVNDIWRVRSKSDGIKGVIWSKAVSVVMVLAVGIILLGWLVFDAWLRIVRRSIQEPSGLPLKSFISFILSWAFWTPVYAFMLKWLPERKLEWKDVWLGGIVTSFAYSVSKYILSLYFSYSSVSLTGTAGAIVVILLWAYYSSQIFFYGVELSRSYAESYGSLKGTRIADEKPIIAPIIADRPADEHLKESSSPV